MTQGKNGDYSDFLFIKESEFVIKTLLKTKTNHLQAQKVLLVTHSKQLGKKYTFIPQTLPENRKEGTLPNSFYEVSITLMPTFKDVKRKENYRVISLIKTLKKVIS